MEKIYEKVSLELSLLGWEERTSVVSDDFMRAAWKKKGDVGEWLLLIERDTDKEPDGVVCLLELKITRSIAAKMVVKKDIMDATGVESLLSPLFKGVVRLLGKELKGGYICQRL